MVPSDPTPLGIHPENGDAAAGGEYGADAAGMWNFNEGQGNTTQDSAGNNTGIITAPSAWVAGEEGGALSLNTGYVSVGNSTVFDSPVFTIALWIKINTFNSGGAWNNIIMGRETYGVDGNGFRFGYDGNGVLSFWTTQSGGSLMLVASKPIGTDRFYQVAVTYANGKGAMYIDGHQTASATGTYKPPVGVILAINGGVGGTTYSNSTIDDVRFFIQSPLSP